MVQTTSSEIKLLNVVAAFFAAAIYLMGVTGTGIVPVFIKRI